MTEKYFPTRLAELVSASEQFASKILKGIQGDVGDLLNLFQDLNTA